MLQFNVAFELNLTLAFGGFVLWVFGYSGYDDKII